MKTIFLFGLLHLILVFLMLSVNNWFFVATMTVAWYITSHWFGLAVVHHKLFSHRSFIPKSWVAPIGTIINIISFAGTPQRYAIVHRIHHKHVDTDLDPHTPKDHWYVGYFGIMMSDRILSKFTDEEKRKIVNDLFEDFSWIRHLSSKVQLSIIIVFYSILWFVSHDVLVSVLLGSLLSVHVGLAVNVLGHRTLHLNPVTVNRPLLALILGPTWNHKNHHSNPGHYSDAGPGNFEIQAWAVKNFFQRKYLN